MEPMTATLTKSWYSKTHLLRGELTACGLPFSRFTWEWEGALSDLDCKRCLKTLRLHLRDGEQLIYEAKPVLSRRAVEGKSESFRGAS